jgi:AbiV family abortive infection protein
MTHTIAGQDPYSGPLPPNAAADGMRAAFRNACRLTEDADFLIEAGGVPSAASLAALAIEELGKVLALQDLATTTDPGEAAKGWARYRSHSGHACRWMLCESRGATPSLRGELDRLMRDRPFDLGLIDQIAQIGLYTDCLGEGRWSVPDEAVDEALAWTLLRLARLMTAGFAARAHLRAR